MFKESVVHKKRFSLYLPPFFELTKLQFEKCLGKMHYLRFKECLVILVLFQLVLSIPLCERSQHSSILCNEIKVQSVPSLPDFPEDYVMLNGFNDMDSTIAPSTTPPSTANDNRATKIPPCEPSQHSSILCASAPSLLPDFPKDYVMLNGFNDMDSTIAPSTTPPSTANDNPATQNPPSSTTTPSSPEPFSTANPIQFYIDQFKKKPDSNKEKKLRLYNMNTPVERLRIKLHKLVDILINWIKNLD